MFQRKSVLFIVTLFFTLTQNVCGQELLSEVPSSKKEFVASEPKVIATIDWLEATPFDKEKEKRSKQTMLLIAWLTKSPTVTLELNLDVADFSKKNPELLTVFMGGWTKYCLQNNYSNDQVQGTLAGIKSVIKVYKNFSMSKNKEVEKLIELDNNGELENWVKSVVEKR